MTIHPQEFVRRLSLHFLPHRFIKIRHYGILSSRIKVAVVPDHKENISMKMDWVTFWRQAGLDLSMPQMQKVNTQTHI